MDKINFMGSAGVVLPTEKYMKDSFRMIIKKDMEEVFSRIKHFIKANSRKERSMDKEN